jgi:HD-GYP domain-containing protein (c-di-GMP phosphodiesterase class II)|uniref:GAF domain-containing protein n=1 Tax=candidate division WOR-3 bacterium TaxID=2052148 RepID=A0A7V3RHC8_UNCW3
MKSKVSELKKKIRNLEALIDASLLFSSTLDIDALLNIILQKAEELMDAEASSVFRIDEEKNELYFITARGEKGKEVKEIRIPMGKGIVGWVAQHKKPLLVPDVTKDPRWFSGVDKKTKFVTRSILAVPLMVKGRIIGVAEVLNKKGNKPFTKTDLEMYSALANQMAIAIENASLYRELDELFLSSIRAIVEAIDAKDPYTKGHSARVVEYALLIGEGIEMDKESLKGLELSAVLHDVGKIGIPDRILSKPGLLNDEEYSYMKRHPEFGAEIVEPIKKLKDIVPNILHHHERYDGTGYPLGLKGKKIPLGARIIAIADSFDAMTSDRPYRPRMEIKVALEEIKRNRRTQFDPELVEVFIKSFEKQIK